MSSHSEANTTKSKAISLADQGSVKNSEKLSQEDKRIAGLVDVTMITLGMIVSGVVSGWNGAMYIGAGEYLVSLGLCTFGYICLTLCIAEMAGIIAFSGGSFGYARCTLSPFIGYLVGMCDLLQTVLFSASMVYSVSRSLTVATTGDFESPYQPLWWVALYGFIIIVALPGGRWFWNAIAVFTILSIALMLMYCLGTLQYTDYSYWATKEFPAFAGSSHDFMNNMIVPTICYVGVDMITLFGDETKDPQVNIPYGMIFALTLTILLAWWITMNAISMNPGVSEEFMNEDILFPMHFGFEHMFGFSDQAANFIMAPTLMSSVMGFMFASGRQMYSMSKSGLLPVCLSRTYGDRKVPVAAMITTACIGICALLPIWAVDPSADDLYELSMIGACCVYVSMFWCFIVFKLRYGAMDRTFTNPLGIASAIYGIIYFGMVLGTLLFAQLDFNALLAFVPYMILAIVYYFKVVEARQFFSKDEQQKFMKAYILNANRRKKKTSQTATQKALARVARILLGSDAHDSRSGHSNGPASPRVGQNSPRSNLKKVNSTGHGSLMTHDVAVSSVAGQSTQNNKVVPIGDKTDAENRQVETV